MFDTQFVFFDWIIIVLYLLLIGALGVWVNKYIRNISDYLVGGRNAGLALNTASFIGTELGLVTIMYASMEAFSRGFSYLMIPLLALLAAYLIGQSGLVIKRLRSLEVLTVPEYLQQRFNTRVRVTSGILMALAGILNMGLFPKMGATFLTYITGMGTGFETSSVITINIVMTLLILLVVLYTVSGGMVAVLVTDYIQYVILSIGLLIALYFTLSTEGLGWKNMVDMYQEHMGVAAFNPVHPDSYGWSYIIWMFVVYFTVYFCWGPTVSRALTATNPKVARQTFLLSVPGQFIRLAIPAILAFGAFAYFTSKGEFLDYFLPHGLGSEVQHTAVAMPLFLGKLLPAGFVGLISAGLLAAFMSTHDSYFLSWASVISRDVVSPLSGKVMTDQDEIRITRISIVVIGVFLLLWGLWYELPESVWTYMAITGNIYLTGAAAAILGGMYWKRASSTGAMAAMLGGLLSLVGIVPGVVDGKFEWLTIGVLGLGNYALCALLLIIFSLIFPDKQ